MTVKKVSEIVTVTIQAAAAIVAYTYYSGYYVTTTFARNLGIRETELFRLEYIKIGCLYVMMAFAVLGIPLLVSTLSISVRGLDPSLPHARPAKVGNSLNGTIWLSYLFFLPMFATSEDFYQSLNPSFGPFKSFAATSVAALLIGTFATCVLPYLERRLHRKLPDLNPRGFAWSVVEVIRYGALILAVTLIVRSLNELPWIPALFSKGKWFLLVGWLFAALLATAGRWTSYIKSAKGSAAVYPVILAGSVLFWFLSISTYSHGVYKFVSINRGGRLPVTEAFVRLKRPEPALTAIRGTGPANSYGPVYVIEETDDQLFVAADGMDKWLSDFVPIHILSKDDVEYIYVKRISDGFPRYPRPSK
jgi:hypothetical protein